MEADGAVLNEEGNVGETKTRGLKSSIVYALWWEVHLVGLAKKEAI